MFKINKLSIAPEWQQQLSDADLLDIEAMTTREFDWFEKPNRRMGGWSGVSRLYLNPEAPEAERVAVFLKIQNNHCYRTIQNFFVKRLSFEREMDAFEALKHTGHLPELLLFATWSKGKDVGALVVTKDLEGFVCIEDTIKEIRKNRSDADVAIRNVLRCVADATRKMHATGWAHSSFKPKHFFIGKEQSGEYPIRFIDFERARIPVRKHYYVTEDIAKFLRKSDHYLTHEQKMQFLLDYFQTDTFTPKQLKLVKMIEKQNCLQCSVVDSCE